jgi:type IV secretory pathway VirJ component
MTMNGHTLDRWPSSQSPLFSTADVAVSRLRSWPGMADWQPCVSLATGCVIQNSAGASLAAHLVRSASAPCKKIASRSGASRAASYHQVMRRFISCALPLILVAAVLASGCAHAHVGSPAAPAAFNRSIQLNGHRLTLHLTPGLAPYRNQLIVYATGDAGWRGNDRDVFTQLRSWGYAAAGFSAPEYLKHLPGEDGTTTPDRLALDFSTIMNEARTALQLSHSVPAVLVGVSRGADLAVVAAGQSAFQRQLAGVVAVGLTREEEYVHRRRRPVAALELYTYLPQLRDVPLSVIQSTRDNYLPARDARALFGDDTPRRTLHAIEARNHSFAGARPLLYSTLRASLAWVARIGRPTR